MKATVKRENGYTFIDFGGRRSAPVACRSFRPKAHIIADFASHGFQLFNVFPSGIMCALANRTIPYSEFGEVWTGDGEYDWDKLDAQIKLFNDNAPDALVSIMAQLDPPDWYLEKHPECADSWQQLVQNAGYDVWREDARKWLISLIDHMDAALPGRVYGVFLLCGGTTEWYTRDVEGALEPREIQSRAYKRYMNDERAEIPDKQALHHTSDGCLRSPTADADALNYWRFFNDVVTDAILFFARAVKAHTRGEKLVGAFTGYTHGMSLERVMTSSYSEIARLLEDDSVDAYFCPASYKYRKLNSTSGFRVPVDSYALNGKLYFHELDSRTYLTRNHPISRLHAAGSDEDFTTFEDTRAYFRREVGMILPKGQGYWWFDMFEGWFDSPEMMAELEELKRLTEDVAARGITRISEVCEFVDTESTYYLDTKKHYVLQESQSEPLNLMGAPWDSYLTTDLLNPDFNADAYKLFIFPALICPSDAILDRIQELRAQGKSMLFLHASGYIAKDGFSEERMSVLTGVRVSKLSPCVEEGARVALATGETIELGALPAFEALEGEVIARYQDGRAAGGLVTRPQGGFDAYLCAAPAPKAFLRALAARAGAHIWIDTFDPVYACREVMTVFAHEAGARVITPPFECDMRECFSGETYASGGEVRFDNNETKIFALTPRGV